MNDKKLEIIAAPDEPTILTRRVVDAPRVLVFDCFSKPEHLKRWMGPRQMPLVSCEMDFRVGGAYRFVHRSPEGREVGFHGEFREIVWPERIVRTFIVDFWPDFPAVETLFLDELDGKRTMVRSLSVHKTIESRDKHLANGGMERGMLEGYARMDELLASLTSAAA